MKCNPFNNTSSYYYTPGIVSIPKITLSDPRSSTFLAKNINRVSLCVYKVDNGLLPQTTGVKSCDFLILRCPDQHGRFGKSMFVEIKTKNSLDRAYEQLADSITELEKKYPNWFLQFKDMYCRVVFRGKSDASHNSTGYRKLKKVLHAKGFKFDDRVAFDDYSTGTKAEVLNW